MEITVELYEGLGRLFGIIGCGFASYIFFELGREEYRYWYILSFEAVSVASLLLGAYEVYDFFHWLFR